jgi:hypothetical protein
MTLKPFKRLARRLRINIQTARVNYWLQQRAIEEAEIKRAVSRLEAVDKALTYASVHLSILKLKR